MLKISNEDMLFLESLNIKNLDELVSKEKPRDLLIELDNAIVLQGFDKDYFYNDFGKKAQEVYDRILYDNR